MGVTGEGVTPILRTLLQAIDRDRAIRAAPAETADETAKAWTP